MSASTTVTSDAIAARKLDELSRETVTEVVDLIPSFLTKTKQAHEKSPDDGWYSAMQSAIGYGPPFKGIGGIPLTSFSILYHVMDAKSFYQTNVDEGWKELKAQQLGVDPTSPEVYQSWKDDVTNGSEIPSEMMEGMGESQIAYADSWWSPDERMALPSSGSFEKGNEDFFTMSHVVSLAPEWYPEGLIRIAIDLNALAGTGKNGTARPDSYDGMTSPLWVQHPADQPAATGGEALETLNAADLNLGDLYSPSGFPSVQAYIVTSDLSDALNASPSVNEYSVDLTLVSQNPILGPEEVSIVEQVREARTKANEGFGDSPPDSGIKSMIDEIGAGARVTSMSAESPEPDWKTMMDVAGRENRVANRGERFPFEQFQKQIEKSPENKTAILSAAAQLVTESDNPGVLNLVSSLGPGSEHAEFFTALIQRLEGGRPLPEGRGTRSASLKSDMLNRLREKFVAVDPELGPRAHKILDSEGRPDLQLAMLNQHDPQDQKLEVLKTATDKIGKSLDRNLVAATGAKILKDQPERLTDAAKTIENLPEPIRTAFYGQVRDSDYRKPIGKILQLPEEDPS